jgi:hypothetical protein
MAVASEQAAPAARYPKVAAPTTGPIPAAELLGVIEAAAKAGADVSFSCLCLLDVSAPPISDFGVTLAGRSLLTSLVEMWSVSWQSCTFVEPQQEVLVVQLVNPLIMLIALCCANWQTNCCRSIEF